MFETLHRIFMAGVGAISMTQEKAEQIFDEYVKKGQAAKEQKTGFVKEMVDQADKTRASLEKIVSKQVKSSIETMHLVTREDVERIEGKVDKMTAMLEECRASSQKSSQEQ